jgi:hypothetical protein
MTRPTIGEIRAKINVATERLRQADARFAQIAFEKLFDPTLDTRPALALLEERREELVTLEAILPVVEREEAEELEATRAKLAEAQGRALGKALKGLLQHSMSFAVHQQNAVSAYRRMCQAGAEASRLLFDAERKRSNGHLPARLSPGGLKILAVQEINRLGHRIDGEISAPGTTQVPANFYRQFPLSLEEEIRNLTTRIMTSAPEPLSRPHESLPQVAAKPSPHSRASAEARP